MNAGIVGSAAAILMLCGTGLAAAQDVVIAPEQETVIREYVTTHKVQSITAPTDVQITVGSTLPDTVELHAIDVPDVKYRYVVVDGQTVVVEPETRKIIHIMK